MLHKSGMAWLMLFFATTACQQDYSFTKRGDPVDAPVETCEIPVETEIIPGPPDIEVSPLESELGWLVVVDNETSRSTFSIFNLGETDLEINDIYLDHRHSQYTLDYSLGTVQPLGMINFDVTFEPSSSGFKPETIFIQSNDPDEPIVEIALQGTGLAPEIEVTPDFYDFGNPFLGCPIKIQTTVRNIGNSDLKVDNIIYSGTPDLEFLFNETLHGLSPWILEPNEEIISSITYEAYDQIFDVGYLTVNSNDPLFPSVVVSQEGDALIGGTITDNFVQDEIEEVDILFVVDNSCSMTDEQAKLAINAASFISLLDASGADYHLATITTDDPEFRGPVLYHGYPNIVTEFEDQLVAGTGGDTTEMGLQMAEFSTLPGQDAEPGGLFQRPGAVLSIVFVSDEDDYSPLDVFGYYVNYFQGLKTNPDKLLLHAVAEDPSDYIDCALTAYRYEEAVQQTGGIFSSICSDDWAADLRDLANGSLVPNLDFPLSETPVEETIEVYIGGVLLTEGWFYDPIENAVELSEAYAPDAGVLVDITYGYYVDCL